eukprot:6197293-Pleurochrysis_carterae.AAC.7
MSLTHFALSGSTRDRFPDRRSQSSSHHKYVCTLTKMGAAPTRTLKSNATSITGYTVHAKLDQPEVHKLYSSLENSEVCRANSRAG